MANLDSFIKRLNKTVENIVRSNLIYNSEQLSKLNLTSKYKGGDDIVFRYISAVHQFFEYHINKQYPNFETIPIGYMPPYKNITFRGELANTDDIPFAEMTTENLVNLAEESLDFFIKDKINRVAGLQSDTKYYIIHPLQVWEDNNFYKQRKFGFYYWMEITW